MKTYCVSVKTVEGCEIVARLYGEILYNVMEDLARSLIENDDDVEEVDIVDEETGELFHYYDRECFEGVDEPADIDDDMGYDPYEGCYTGDC